jgi:hypothetical protein
MRWDGHAARVGDENVYNILAGKPEGRDKAEYQNVDRRMILKLYCENMPRRSGLDLSGPGWRPMVRSCENRNEPSGSIKGENFFFFFLAVF